RPLDRARHGERVVPDHRWQDPCSGTHEYLIPGFDRPVSIYSPPEALMPLLFPREQDDEFVGGADAATRRLSLMSLETAVVESVYGKMASVYDLFFGLPLHHGRAAAIHRMGIR